MTYSRVAIIEELRMEGQRSGVVGLLCPTSSLDGDGWLTACPARFTPTKELIPIIRGGGVGPKAGLDGYGEQKMCLRTPDCQSWGESLCWVAKKKSLKNTDLKFRSEGVKE